MSDNGATNGNGPPDEAENWTPLRPDPGSLAESEAVKVRAPTLGLAAALDTVQRDPDALWVNSAQGLRAVDRSKPEDAHAVIMAARQALARQHNGSSSPRGPSHNGA